jgi:hypothetical protein
VADSRIYEIQMGLGMNVEIPVSRYHAKEWCPDCDAKYPSLSTMSRDDDPATFCSECHNMTISFPIPIPANHIEVTVSLAKE